jgi:hypothetical protein
MPRAGLTQAGVSRWLLRTCRNLIGRCFQRHAMMHRVTIHKVSRDDYESLGN